jgi:hypothetical protein
VTDSGAQHAAPAAPALVPVEDVHIGPTPDDIDQATAPEPTGHDAVDEVTASLARLEGLPVDEHVAVFESAHDRLRAVLASGGAPSAPTS